LLSPPPDHKLPEVLKAKYEWLSKKGKLQTILAHWADEVPPERLQDLQTYVVYMCFENIEDPRPQIPAALADTVPGNPRGFPYCETRRVNVTAGFMDGKTWYMVTPRAQPQRDVFYDVVVDDPLAVNQLLRAGVGASKYHIASFFLAKGIKFKTLCRYMSPRYLMWPSPPMPMFTPEIPLGLGIRQSSMGAITVNDYEQYLQLRDEVISGYNGRAAFLAGGIVWRLAMDAMSDIGVALDGPDKYPTMRNHTTFDSKGYVDDVLDKHQEDIICGVYRIVPSKLILICY
jgi:hypothetical protein